MKVETAGLETALHTMSYTSKVRMLLAFGVAPLSPSLSKRMMPEVVKKELDVMLDE